MTKTAYTVPAEYADPGWLRETGILQEVNRQFLHPLGLALQVGWCDHKETPIVGPHEPDKCPYEGGFYVGVLDYTEDPEGMYFDLKAEGEPQDSIDKAQKVQTMLYARLPAREAWAKENGEHLDARGVQLLTYVEHERDTNADYLG